jgi:hypothetical protein
MFGVSLRGKEIVRATLLSLYAKGGNNSVFRLGFLNELLLHELLLAVISTSMT